MNSNNKLLKIFGGSRRGKVENDEEEGKAVEREEAPPQAAPMKHFKFPNKYARMEEHIMNAERSSGPFEYVAIASRETSTFKKLLEALSVTKASVRSYDLSFDDLPIYNLSKRSSSISISSPLSLALQKKDLHFCWLKEVYIFFVPTQSFSSSYSEITFELNDNRFVEESLVRSITFPSNVGINGHFSLDYSVFKDDLPMISFSVKCKNSYLKEGVVWGSLKLVIQTKFSDQALIVSTTRTAAILQMADTTMKTYDRDPNHLDLMFDDPDLEMMKKFAKQGRIVDHNQALGNRERIAMSGSEAGSIEGSQSGNSRVKEEWLRGTRFSRGRVSPVASVEEDVRSDDQEVGEFDLTPNDFTSSGMTERAFSKSAMKAPRRSLKDPSTSPETAANTSRNEGPSNWREDEEEQRTTARNKSVYIYEGP
ncbi:ORF2a protein [Lentinula edodes negative-strand RNA virus 2]|uniref:ORF2a protein n=1 Tax=Lentinula edodes negative-strand RNA virus 2 TaxID=2547431 RepID=A0A4P2VQ28_9VIRU|nr:ORF2a protein [Lentinula edodes negative-strand RNA virus 2]BBI93119.1 ORF2a protein [Lentinula edodes negative-strand RNA virus 2]